MDVESHLFPQNARKALLDDKLQAALSTARGGFVDKRRQAVEQYNDRGGDFEALRDRGRDIRNAALARLDELLVEFEANVGARGGQVHWAESTDDAAAILTRLCREAGGGPVIKSKSMISEEANINAALADAGVEVTESDLGEYILQLGDERPSHIIAPAVHKSRDDVSRLFQQHHAQYGFGEWEESVPALVAQARTVLRQRYCDAGIGITGANFLLADSGAAVIVTNEGNADLGMLLPKTHIVIASIDKVVPGADEAAILARLLARSATGQHMAVYTTIVGGPGEKQGEKVEPARGAEHFHVVLLDNGRSEIANGPFREILRCIRCSACMNHCPVYQVVGGHAYGWVYPGPVGSVVTPLLTGEEEAKDLPNACTLNGACKAVCPVRIPLPELLRRHRQVQFESRIGSQRARWSLALWAQLAKRPRLYHVATGVAQRMLGWIGRGRLRRLPLAGGWTGSRDLPLQNRRSFIAEWHRR